MRRGVSGDRPTASPIPLPPATGSPGLPAPVTIAATERASADPILRLFIEDLHERLSQAHTETAALHIQRAGDAATIARLGAEIADINERLQGCQQELHTKGEQNRYLRQKLNETQRELEITRRKLAVCLEGTIHEEPTRGG